MDKAGAQAVELRIRAGETGDSGGRAVALDDEIVDSGSATGILDWHPGARADVIETRAEEWGHLRQSMKLA